MMYELSYDGGTFICGGKLYNEQNREDLPDFGTEGKARVIEYRHPTSRETYFFFEKDVVAQIIEENEEEILEKKRELEEKGEKRMMRKNS